MTTGVRVERSLGSAHEFHHRPLELDDARPAIWIQEVERPALVLGSSQSDDIVDRDAAVAAGWEVTGRRSGGGIVVVEPGHSCWIDVVLPRGHARWDDDVNRAFAWVGEWWRLALTDLGLRDLVVYDGPIVARDHGRAVCFAGIGPGEVLQQTPGGHTKVVGLSQRRTRDVARFQGLYLSRWNPEPIERFVRHDALPADLDLSRVAAGLASDAAPDSPTLATPPTPPTPGDVADAFVARSGFVDQLD